MIIMGVDYGNNPAGFRMSTTADYVLRNARCPVIIWRSGTHSSPLQGE